MNKVFLFSLTLWICIFFSFFFHFLSFWMGEKWEEKRISFLFFSSLNFLIQNDRILLFLLFFLSFCFFSSVFLMIFSLFSFYLLFWEWEKENEISVISSLFSSFLGRSNWKKWRKFFLFFVPFFLIFSFWKPFSFSVFPSFSGGGMEREKDKGNCPNRAKRNLQEHSIFFKCVFGKKNTPKIHILCQKYA